MPDLLHLPAELLDAVIERIYAPADLVSLACTCRRLCDLVLHDHLNWRSVNVLFEDLPYLYALLNSQRKTLLVQRLRVESYGDESPVTGFRTIRPTSRREPKLEELVETLAAISKSLRSLRTIELILDALDFGLFDGFFPSLRAASPFFTNLSISAALVVGEAHEKLLERSLAVVISGIGGLTHFHWDSDDYFENPIITAVEDQLMKYCPLLEHLELRFLFDPRILAESPPSASTRLWEGHWPELKWLQLDRVATNESTGTFLDNHTKLETLCLDRHAYPWEDVPFQLDSTCLPNLRQVSWPFKQDTNTLLTLLRPLPDGTKRPIEILSQVTITTYDNLDPTIVTHQSDGFLSDEQFEELCVLLGEIPTLRILGLENERASGIPKLAQLASMAPSVREVLLSLRAWPGTDTMAAIAQAMGNFRSLTSLHLLAIDPWIEQEWIEAAKLFARESPGLVHFSGFDWIVESEEWVRQHPISCSVCNEAWPLTLE